MSPSWHVAENRIVCSADGAPAYEDTTDHWTNGVLRLLRIDETTARRWVELAVADGPLADEPEARIVERLGAAWSSVTGSHAPVDVPFVRESIFGSVPDRVVAPALAEGAQFAVVESVASEVGWLVDPSTGCVPTTATAEYEDDYFEGDIDGVGYGSYLEQQGWRLEKAARMVRQVSGIRQFLGCPAGVAPSLLDVGCGYGFFRRAAGDAGWSHDGLEVSHHAAKAGGELFGFDSFVGDLATFANAATRRYDVITMWDVLEHVVDPVELLRDAASLLTPGGLAMIRTPNLCSTERAVFGASFHSLKAEHRWYFGPASLLEIVRRAGLRAAFATTEAHLFQGFLGHRVQELARLLRGSDFLLAAQRPA